MSGTACRSLARRAVVGLVLAHVGLASAGTALALTFVHEPVDQTGDVGQNNDLALDQAGNPHIAYWDFTGNDLEYAVRTNGTWLLETPDAGAGAGQLPSIVLDSQERPRIAYLETGGFDLRLAERNGGIWVITLVDTTGMQGAWASLALDAADQPRISYHAHTGRDLRYAERNGGTWTTETVDSIGIVGAGTALALDAAGNPHIAYHDQTNRDLKYATRSGGVWTIELVDGAGQTGVDPDIALDALGRPHVVYRDLDTGDLRYAVRDGGVWSAETAFNGPNAGINPSLVLDANDTPHVTFYLSTPGDLLYLHREGAVWVGFPLQTQGDVGFDSSLQLGSDGLPRVSYYDVDAKDLRYGEVVSTLLVPTHFATIQAAIDAAQAGDTVRVEGGLYTGLGNKNLDFGGKDLVVGAFFPGDAELDLENSGRAFHLHGGEGPASVIENFRIRNGNVSQGAAIRLESSSPVIRGCSFFDQQLGGAIHAINSSPRIEDCDFGNNRSQLQGGAIALTGVGDVTITGCDFAGNQVGAGGTGGTLHASGVTARLTGCTIRGGIADSGGAIRFGTTAGMPRPLLTLDDCVVAGNLAQAGDGGGLFLVDANAEITASTFTDNRATGRGGSIHLAARDTVTVERSIVWGSCAGAGGDEVFLAGASPADPIHITFQCSDVAVAGVAGLGSVLYLGDMIDTDPSFTLAIGCLLAPGGGLYGLECDSPCHAHVSPCGMRIGADRGGCDLVDAGGGRTAPTARLLPPVPQPAVGGATLRFELPRRAVIRLALYDARGRRVRLLAAGSQAQGRHRLAWDGRDDHARAVPAGVYFQRLEVGGRTLASPIVLLR